MMEIHRNYANAKIEIRIFLNNILGGIKTMIAVAALTSEMKISAFLFFLSVL